MDARVMGDAGANVVPPGPMPTLFSQAIEAQEAELFGTSR